MRFILILSLVGTLSGVCSARLNSVKELLTFVEREKAPHTIEELLERLPIELRSYPVFIYRSRSIQEASMESPRVFLSEPDGDLVLAFNGDPSHRGYQEIEAMEFDEASKRFRFYELGFSGSGQLQASLPNPQKCLTCHRSSDPRPNWESYDRWPGAYGSMDDRLTADEIKPFKSFLISLEKRPRYSSLVVEPLKRILTYTDHGGRLPGEPNITFTHTLSQNNFKRLARLITETKDYERFKYAIMGVLSTASYFSQGIKDFIPKEHLPLLSYYSLKNVKEAEEIPISIGDALNYSTTLLFRSVFESRGIDTSDWFLNFKGGVNNTWINGLPWEIQLIEALLEADASLRKFLYMGSTDQLDNESLSEASQKALSNMNYPQSYLEFSNDPSVPNRIWKNSCVQCHGLEKPIYGPLFSFEQAVRNPKFHFLIENGLMPKEQLITPSQKTRLLEILSISFFSK